MSTVAHYGLTHGTTVYHRRLAVYGVVHAYGVLTARGPMAEIRWSGPIPSTEALTALVASQVMALSGDLPRAPRPRMDRPAVPATFPDGVRAGRVTPRKPRSRAPRTGTEHTCNGGNGPMWGRKLPGCPRCDELLAGAPARTWG
jgi:hypothetical protein